MKAKLLIISLGTILILNGCTKKYCQQHYPCNDSTVTSEVTKFDTTYLQLPSDTTFIELPFDCPDQQVIYRDGKKEIIYKIKDRILTVNEVTFADSIRIINKFKESKEFKQYAKEVEIIKFKTPKNNYYLIGGLILIVLIQNRKKILSLIKILIGRFT